MHWRELGEAQALGREGRREPHWMFEKLRYQSLHSGHLDKVAKDFV